MIIIKQETLWRLARQFPAFLIGKIDILIVVCYTVK